MKDFKFLSDNKPKDGVTGPTGYYSPVGVSGTTEHAGPYSGSTGTYYSGATPTSYSARDDYWESIARDIYATRFSGTTGQSVVKMIVDEDYEPINDPHVVEHTSNFILNVYLFGIVITGLVKLFVYAGF